jgi:hypothetical protein
MRRCLVGVTIGVVLGCADGGGDAPAPRFGDACEDGEPARCGHGQGGTNVPRNVVLVCDGGAWDEGVRCGEFSECSDDASGGVLCEAGDEPAIVYGEHTGNCDTDGAQACSFERDFVLACEAGKWNIATNCSTEVQHCALQSGEFVCA